MIPVPLFPLPFPAFSCAHPWLVLSAQNENVLLVHVFSSVHKSAVSHIYCKIDFLRVHEWWRWWWLWGVLAQVRQAIAVSGATSAPTACVRVRATLLLPAAR